MTEGVGPEPSRIRSVRSVTPSRPTGKRPRPDRGPPNQPFGTSRASSWAADARLTARVLHGFNGRVMVSAEPRVLLSRGCDGVAAPRRRLRWQRRRLDGGEQQLGVQLPDGRRPSTLSSTPSAPPSTSVRCRTPSSAAVDWCPRPPAPRTSAGPPHPASCMPTPTR